MTYTEYLEWQEYLSAHQGEQEEIEESLDRWIASKKIEENSEEMKYVRYEQRQDFLKDK